MGPGSGGLRYWIYRLGMGAGRYNFGELVDNED